MSAVVRRWGNKIVRVVVTGGSDQLDKFVVREMFTRAHQASAIDTVNRMLAV